MKNNKNNEDIVMEVESVPPCDEKPAVEIRKSFEELDRKQQLRRTEQIWENLNNVAENENLDVGRLLGFLLTRCSSVDDRDVGKKVFAREKTTDSIIPIITALTIYCDCNLGRVTYSTQRRLLSAVGFPIFPSWDKLRKMQESITPPILSLPEPHQGVYFPFVSAVETTMVRIFGNDKFEVASQELKLKMKYGFDGSGSHAIYKQKNNAQTSNMILSVFCPINLTIGKEQKVWEERGLTKFTSHTETTHAPAWKREP